MSAGDGPEVTYDGEVENQTYTVQVFPTESRAVSRGKQQVLLRVRYRGRTEDFVEMVPRSFTELAVHTIVRRLISDRWPTTG
jgi:hypothetical protein